MAVKAPGQQLDHRRVPNLETWFTRHDKTRPSARTPVTIKRAILSPGDWIRTGTYWGGVRWLRPRRYAAVIHNIGAGAQEEDVLFSWRMWGIIVILLNKRSPHMKKKFSAFYTDSFFFLTAHQRQCQHISTIPLPSTAPGFSPSSHQERVRRKRERPACLSWQYWQASFQYKQP